MKISADGQKIDIDAEGFVGSGCKDFARKTIEAIGTVQSEKKKDEYYLIAVNNAEESKYSMIELDKKLFPAGKPERKLKGINLLNNEKCEMNASGEIPVYVPRKSGTIVRIRQARS
ncbi:MAG: DUF2997 domain-containing protein [Spirochaetes bacterium]|nr:DUF2997 domain-containing protein [Spirochaetota bacterium]